MFEICLVVIFHLAYLIGCIYFIIDDIKYKKYIKETTIEERMKIVKEMIEELE